MSRKNRNGDSGLDSGNYQGFKRLKVDSELGL